MKSFILVWCGSVIFTRLSLNKIDMQHKDSISIVLALLLTSFLTAIQFIVGFIINLIF